MHIAEFVFCQTQISVSISQLIKKIFALNFEGGLIDHQSCFTQNLKILAVREPAFLKDKFGQNRPLILF